MADTSNSTGSSFQQAGSNLSDMANQAGTAVSDMASQVAKNASQKADDLTASAGAGLRDLGDRISKQAPHDGMAGSASQAVADTFRRSGQYLEESKFGGVSEDLTELIKQYPVTAVLIAASLGWFLARRL